MESVTRTTRGTEINTATFRTSEAAERYMMNILDAGCSVEQGPRQQANGQWTVKYLRKYMRVNGKRKAAPRETEAQREARLRAQGITDEDMELFR